MFIVLEIMTSSVFVCLWRVLAVGFWAGSWADCSAQFSLTFCGFSLNNSKNNRFGCLPAAFTSTSKPRYWKRKPLVPIIFCSTTLNDVPPIRPQLSVPCVSLLNVAQPTSSNNNLRPFVVSRY